MKKISPITELNISRNLSKKEWKRISQSNCRWAARQQDDELISYYLELAIDAEARSR